MVSEASTSRVMVLPVKVLTRFAYHRAGAKPSAESTLSGCCNPIEYDRPPIACRRKSNAADRGECLLYLEFWSSIFDGVRSLHIKGDGLASQSLDENLHTATQAQNQVQRRFFLDIVIRQSATVLQLLAGENQTLPIGGNAFFILNFGFHIFDGVGGLHVEGNGFSGQGLDENLHFRVVSTGAVVSSEEFFFL